jgi:ceramide glucosyltransferase
MFHEIVPALLMVAAACGCLYMVVATVVIARAARPVSGQGASAPSVTILKPLHGDEPGLFENLASFCEQDYAGAVQIVLGVSSAGDAAVAVVEKLRAAFPDKTLDLVIDARVAGTNPKVANLINMSPRIAHDIVVIADSDMRVGPDYLTRIVDLIAQVGDGAVTVPYYGIATGSIWSRLAQLTIDGHFLPGVVVGERFGLSRPCLGSTIALRRTALAAVGGFEAVAGCLADDYELGALMRRRGERVIMAPFAIGHVFGEASFAELWSHELRWATTIRNVDLVGYLGWSITHAFPLALIAWALGGGGLASALVWVSLACRTAVIFAVERAYGLPLRPYWLIPVRDMLSFAIFIGGFLARDVNWRGQRYRLLSEGTMMSERRSPTL